MRQRSRLVTNSLLNVLARLVAIATRFIIVPFAIGVLGRGHYGAWVVVGQLFAYTRILDMGLRSAISRQVAVSLARGEGGELNRQVNTAAGYYMGVGILIVVLTVIVSVFFSSWFDIERELRSPARIMVLCSGLALAFSIPLNAYSAVIAGLQRYDVMSGTQILADLLRFALILFILQRVDIGGGLIVLALASGGSALCGAILRTLAALRLCPHVKFEPWRVDRSLLGGLLLFGVNSVVYMMSVTVGMHLAQILVGALMSRAEATDLYVAGLLLVTCHSFVVAFSISARVVASRYDAEGNDAMLRKLLLRSSRYCGLVTVAGAMALWLFSGALFRLWIGDQYQGVEGEASLEQITAACRVMTIGYGLFWLLLPAYNVLNGIGRHRVPAVLALAAGLASMALVGVFTLRPGATIDRVVWGLVIPMIPVWGIVMPWYCCRTMRQPIGTYIRQALAVPLLACLPVGVVGVLWNHYSPATTWWELIGQLASCGMLFLPIAWFAVLIPNDRLGMINWTKRLPSRIMGT